MTTITHLSDEIIVTILEYTDISVEDIMRLQSTCKRLQHITFNTKFWGKKYFQRFPLSKSIYNKEKLEKLVNHLEAGVKCIEELRHYVSLMFHNNLQDIEKMELNKFLRSIAEDSIIYSFVLDDIDRIIAEQLLWHDSNLTAEYLFRVIYQWLKQYRLVYKQTKFIYMPMEKLLLEKQITIIAQYFQPYVSYSIIDTWLDDTVQKVLSRLKNKYPTHSIFSTSPEQFTLWRNNNINDTFWNSTEAKQIMCILDEFIFSVLCVRQLLRTLDIEMKFIIYVLKHYEKCLLSIIYHSVARRLGLHIFLRYDRTFKMTILCGPLYYADRSTTYFIIKYPYNFQTLDVSFEETWLIHMHPLNPLRNILEIRKLISVHSWNYYNLWIDLQLKHQLSYKWNMEYILNFLSHCWRDNVENIHMDYEYTHITHSIKNFQAAKYRPFFFVLRERLFSSHLGSLYNFLSQCWDLFDHIF